MPLWDCAICPGKAEAVQRGLETTFTCPRCGTYSGRQRTGGLPPVSVEHQIRLSGWVREQNNFGAIPLITAEISNRVAAMKLPRLRERANRALAIVAEAYPRLDGATSIGQVAKDEKLQGATYSRDPSETMSLLQILIEDGHLSGIKDSTTNRVSAVSLTGKGALTADALRASVPNSAQGFVAMSFSDQLRDAWINGFDPAIRAAGYRPMRIDAKDYAGGVMDEIIAEIRQSRFVIADCTQQRNGVYFEAGFAIGLGLTVIPTCRADDMENRHFDIQHLNTLEWQTPADLGQALTKRILAVVGPGPDLPPP